MNGSRFGRQLNFSREETPGIAAEGRMYAVDAELAEPAIEKQVRENR